MGATIRNPFLDDIYGGAGACGLPTSGTVAVNVHPEALRRMLEEVVGEGEEAGWAPMAGSQGMGRVLLLLAPRAGFGKSHLLGQFEHEAGDRVHCVRLAFNPESPVRWENVFRQILASLTERVGGDRAAKDDTNPSAVDSRLTRLDLVARDLFAGLNHALIAAGTIPCADPDGAMAALRSRSVELFDFSDPDQGVARWFAEHFGKLLRPAAEEAARWFGMAPSRAGYWLRGLCAYAQSAGEAPTSREEAARLAFSSSARPSPRFGEMAITEVGGAAGRDDEAEAKDKVRDLCRIAGGFRPLALLLDQLDSLYRDPENARRLAYFISEIQSMVPRELTLVSLNEDVWATAFEGHLPSAYQDRLTGNVVNLKGVGLEEAEALVEARLAGVGVEASTRQGFRCFLRLEEYFAGERGRMVSPRVVLRYAAIHWDVFAGESKESQSALAKVETRNVTELSENIESTPEPVPGEGVTGRSVETPARRREVTGAPVESPVAGEAARASASTVAGRSSTESEEVAAMGFLEGDQARDRVIDSGLEREIVSAVRDLSNDSPTPDVAETKESGQFVMDEEPAPTIEKPADDGPAEARVQPQSGRRSVLPRPRPRSPESAAREKPASENAFHRLKEMLARLRQERAQRHVEEASEGGSHPATAESLTNRGDRTALPQSEGEATDRSDSVGSDATPERATAADVASDETHEDSRPSADSIAEARRPGASVSMTEGAKVSLTPDRARLVEVAKGDPIMAAFRAERERWRQESPQSELDWERFEHLIAVSGKRFPIVRYEVFALPEVQGHRVAKWAFRDNEIYFGFVGIERRDFWEALNRFVEGRIRMQGGDERLRAKAIGFVLPRGAAPDTSDLASLDVVVLSRSELASIYAADELLRQAERGESDVDPGQILGLLASELDVFWRRITRPVARHRRDAA